VRRPHHAVGHHGQQQRNQSRSDRHQQREDSRGLERGQVGGVENSREVLQPDELGGSGPKGVLCSTLWYSAWPAGQKKNTRMMAICGAISSQGSQAI
jgi:hypothetical protein